ncbi:MAG: hypothetical protein ABIT96_04800 [Ferruginibacter sp.]
MKKLLPAISKSFTLLVLSIIFIFKLGYSQTTATFTSSGTWTCPTGVTSISVESWGGGGAGGGTTSNNTAACGGGGGAYTKNNTVTVIPGTIYNITVAGTSIGSNGAGVAGSSSTAVFGVTTVTATGGAGGGTSGGTGGAGGTTGTYTGGAGATGVSGTFNGGGGGSSAGSASAGNAGSLSTGGVAVTGGGAGGNGASGNSTVDGSPGSFPGGGGGGAYKKSGQSPVGGNGGGGQVKITFTQPVCPASNAIAPASSQALCVSDASTTLTATVTNSGSTGTPTLQYQWYYNLSNNNTVAGATSIAGATSQTFSPGTSLAESGTRYYFCVGYAANNGCSQSNTTQSLASNTVQVTVSPAASIPGTYSVGPTGTYASIAAAISALSTGCAIGGIYVFELQSTYNSSVESFPINLPSFSWASTTNTITIRPAAGATNLSITGSSTTGILNLTASKYYIIDGRAGGTGSTKNLSIINTSASGYVMQFVNDAQNNVIKFCSVQGVNSLSTSGNIVFSTSATTNGNSNNTIDNCDIKDGATTPSNAIYSNGTSTAGRQNINNIISNSNISNFFSATNGGNGIYLGAGTTDWTITGNSFYQTSSRVLSSSDIWSAIQVNNTASGNNINISNNYFGGTAANAASGTMTFTGGGILNLIRMAGSTGTANSIQGNIIRNISFTTSSNATPHALIRHLQGNINIGNLSGNTIGSQSANGNILFSCSATCEFAGISGGINSIGSADVINISNNNVGGIDISGSGSSAVQFAGIKLRGVPGSCTINNNIVGSTTTVNSISNSTAEELNGIQVFVGSSTGMQTISNNTLANLLVSNAANSKNILYGINVKDATAGTAGGIYTISTNNIYKLTSASKIPVGAYTTAGIGFNSTAQGGQKISGNIIYNLHDTDPTAATGIVGIDYAGPSIGFNLVEKNFIHDLTMVTDDVTGPSLGVMVGLNINNGTTTYSNNAISLGDSSGVSITKSYEIYGIGDYIGEVPSPKGFGNNDYLNNTVYIGGSSVSGASNRTFAYYNSVPDTRARTIKNNIFYNARSGTGTHYAMYYPSNVTGVTNVTSDYNDIYVSGTGGKIAYLNGVNYDTITTWRAATSKDAMSVTDDPLLVNPAGSVAGKDLHILVGSICNNEASPVTPIAVTSDFDGTPRDGVHGIYPATPDIGAYELVRGTSPGTWIGILSTDWFNTSNWDDGVVPTNIIHTYIARGHNDASATQHFPVIPTGGSAQTKNLTLHLPTTNLTVTGTGIMKVAGTIKSGVNINKGKFNLVDGTLELNGTSGTQNIAGNMFFQTTIKNLTASNSVNITNQWSPDTVRITGIASFGNVNSKTITTNGNLTLVSSVSGTAALIDITNGGINNSNIVTGNVTVERFINAGRKWRFLSLPTSGQTFKQAWQEGATSSAQNPKPGYGMYITDNNNSTWTGNGFDAYSIGGPSIKKYDASSNTWVGISNTGIVVSGTQGLMTFVRGNRANAVTSSTITTTVLRSTGTLYQNTQPDITVPAGTFVTIGNPYAAAVDLRLLDKANTTDFFYVWDPKLSGLYSVGAYQIFSRNGANYVVTPGGGSYGTPGVITNYLESGQAFFIRGAGAAGRVTFKENAKAYGNVYTPYVVQGQSQDLRVSLLIPGTDTLVADGVFVNYDDNYSNGVDDNDGLKFSNANENVTLKRNNTLLSVERRTTILGTDTLFINTTGLRAQSYLWSVKADNMDAPGRFGYLIDKFLQSSTLLNLSDATQVAFTVDNTPGSSAADRFMIVFNEAVVVPVTFTGISANRKTDGTIAVEWKSENEINIQSYELQHSDDSRNFTNLTSKAPANYNLTVGTYNYIDVTPGNGNNYYRVKAISENGSFQYSAVVKVSPAKMYPQVQVYPNPVSDKKMNVQFTNQEKGVYNLQVTNEQGQIILSTAVQVNADVSTNTVMLPSTITTGHYNLLIIKPDGTKSNQKLIVR